MKRPSFIVAAIDAVIFMPFLIAIVFWTGVYPGLYLTSSPSAQP